MIKLSSVRILILCAKNLLNKNPLGSVVQSEHIFEDSMELKREICVQFAHGFCALYLSAVGWEEGGEGLIF